MKTTTLDSYAAQVVTLCRVALDANEGSAIHALATLTSAAAMVEEALSAVDAGLDKTAVIEGARGAAADFKRRRVVSIDIKRYPTSKAPAAAELSSDGGSLPHPVASAGVPDDETSGGASRVAAGRSGCGQDETPAGIPTCHPVPSSPSSDGPSGSGAFDASSVDFSGCTDGGSW